MLMSSFGSVALAIEDVSSFPTESQKVTILIRRSSVACVDDDPEFMMAVLASHTNMWFRSVSALCPSLTRL